MLIVALMIVFTTLKEVIVGLLVEDGEVDLKRSVTINFTIMEKVLMVMREVDIGLRTALYLP